MNINFSFTNEEYDKLKRWSNLSRMSIEEYVKFKLFGNVDDIENLISIALEKIRSLPSGTPFSIKQLFGTDWNTISRGSKLALGKKMLVKSNENNSTFEATHKDSKNTQWYIKR